jgi:hypothetical protein
MSFCPDTNTVFTTDSLLQTYGSTTQQSILPLDGFTQTDRDTNGILKPDVIKQYVTSLLAQGKVPKAPAVTEESRAVEEYMAKDNRFITAVKEEYCFYNSRYKYALRQLITKLQEGYISSDAAKKMVVEDYLNKSRALNMKLNDITQIANEITRVRLQSTQNQNTDINTMNSDLQSRSALLSEQNKVLSSEQATATLYKQMEKYTRERASATNNMLGLYSVMNIVMIGTLFYMYRSMSA